MAPDVSRLGNSVRFQAIRYGEDSSGVSAKKVIAYGESCRHTAAGNHYGYIQLKALNDGTQVTQVAYFDFWGVSLWAAYPWAGGMKDFLIYTARWEQETVKRLQHRYRSH